MEDKNINETADLSGWHKNTDLGCDVKTILRSDRKMKQSVSWTSSGIERPGREWVNRPKITVSQITVLKKGTPYIGFPFFYYL